MDNIIPEMPEDVRRDFEMPNRLSIDCDYILRDGERHPIAIICPGGGYGMVCSFVEGRPFAKRLNELGISAAIVYYRVREEAAFPAPQDDLAEAVKSVLSRADELCIDAENYSVWGSSAGGHLAASFGTESMGYPKYGLPKPAALVLVYPVITMGGLTHAGSRENLIGKSPSEEMVRLTSVEQQVTESYPATFVWTGDSDNTVPPANSAMLAEALAKCGIPHEYVVYPGVDHGVGVGAGLACEGWLERAVAFWRGQTGR